MNLFIREKGRLFRHADTLTRSKILQKNEKALQQLGLVLFHTIIIHFKFTSLQCIIFLLTTYYKKKTERKWTLRRIQDLFVMKICCVFD